MGSKHMRQAAKKIIATSILLLVQTAPSTAVDNVMGSVVCFLTPSAGKYVAICQGQLVIVEPKDNRTLNCHVSTGTEYRTRVPNFYHHVTPGSPISCYT